MPPVPPNQTEPILYLGSQIKFFPKGSSRAGFGDNTNIENDTLYLPPDCDFIVDSRNYAVASSADMASLTVTGGATFNSDVLIKGSLGVSGTVGVTGAVTLYSTLNVTSGATFNSFVYVEGALGVTGAVNLHDTLVVSEGATFNSFMYVEGALGVTGAVNLHDTLIVTEGATFNSFMYVEGALGVTGAVNLYSTLQVASGATFESNLHVALGATFGGNVTLASGKDLTLTLGDIHLARSKDIYVGNETYGLQEQIAYLYSYWFQKSYKTIKDASQAADRSFDADGDDGNPPKT